MLRLPGRAVKSDCMISLIGFKSYEWNQAITLAYHTQQPNTKQCIAPGLACPSYRPGMKSAV